MQLPQVVVAAKAELQRKSPLYPKTHYPSFAMTAISTIGRTLAFAH